MSITYYAVHRIDNSDYKKPPVPAVYTNWKDCKAQVEGHNNCVYKKFKNLADAKYFVVAGETKQSSKAGSTKKAEKSVKRTKALSSTKKKLRSDSSLRSESSAEPRVKRGESSDSESERESTPKVSPKHESDEYIVVDVKLKNGKILIDNTDISLSGGGPRIIEVWTDGSSFNNGKRSCKAGYGVFFGLGDQRNVSGPVRKDPSNQRAELLAIKRALEILSTQRDSANATIRIYTDSEYSIKCITVWASGWISNNWKTSKGETVKHRDLITDILNLRKQLAVEFIHINSHMEQPKDRATKEYRLWYGNFMADKLALEGANKTDLPEDRETCA